MSENSKIEWTDHTFNPWWGCQKVSAGCKNCYAEILDNRWKGGHWGPGSDRKPMSEKYWAQPLKWNDAAAKGGIPAKVFCASMADVFEDHPQITGWRERLFEIIERTPCLIWQLLTKRSENIMRMVPEHWRHQFPGNVWIGTSVEDQAASDARIPHLLRVPAVVRFLSCEPLLSEVDLSEYISLTETNGNPEHWEKHGWMYDDWSGGFMGPGQNDTYDARSGIHWIIAGGESGPHARPMHPDWVRSLRDQCHAAEIPFFFKQWGEWYTDKIRIDTGMPAFKKWRNYEHFTQKMWAKKGDACIDMSGKLCKIGADFKSASYPIAIMQRIGKGKSGRLLDGREWNQFPKVQTNNNE